MKTNWHISALKYHTLFMISNNNDDRGAEIFWNILNTSTHPSSLNIKKYPLSNSELWYSFSPQLPSFQLNSLSVCQYIILEIMSLFYIVYNFLRYEFLQLHIHTQEEPIYSANCSICENCFVCARQDFVHLCHSLRCGWFTWGKGSIGDLGYNDAVIVWAKFEFVGAFGCFCLGRMFRVGGKVGHGSVLRSLLW